MSIYNDGNIRVKVGSATVLGYNTEWTSVYEDYLMKISDSSFYTIASVLSATMLTVTPIYQNRQYDTGDIIKGARYYIVRDYTDNFGFPEITNDNEDVLGIYTHGIRMVDEQFTYVNEDFTVIDGGLLIGTGNGWAPYDFGGHIGISNGNASSLDDDGNPNPVDPGDDNTGEDDDNASTIGGTPIDPPGEPPTEVDNYEDSLVCWLKLDETSGNIAYDSSASAVNASVMGYTDDDCWVGDRPAVGHNGKGWRSQTGSQYIKCGSSYQTTFRSSFTVCGWMAAAGRWPTTSIFGGARDAISENMVQLSLGVWTNNSAQSLSQCQIYYYADSDSASYNGDNTELDGYLSPLTHYAFVFTENQEITVYKNGVQQFDNGSGDPSMVGVDMSTYANTLPFTFGALNWNSPSYFINSGGVLADLRIYSTALTGIQVQSICRQDELAYKRIKKYMYQSRSENDYEVYLNTIYDHTYLRWGKGFDHYYLWNNIDLPTDAVVRDSAMMFKTIYEAGIDTVYSYIEAENTGNASAFEGSATEFENFNAVASDIAFHFNTYPTWNNFDEHTTPDIHSPIKQVTDRGDWTQGNNIYLKIRNVVASSVNYQRTWMSGDYPTTTYAATLSSPKLYINYAVATTAIIPGVATLSNTYLVYPLNEGVKQVITNNGYSGYTGNLLNVTASPPRDNWASGIDDGYAVVFNATMETYIDSNDNGVFSDELYNGPFTLCTWIDQDDGASSCAYGGALAWDGGHRPGFIFGNDAGKLYVDYKLTSSPLQDVRWESAATVLGSGQTDWTHLAVAVTGNDYIKVYKDAALQTANATHNGYIPMSTSNFDASSILPETFFGCYNHHSLNDTDHFQGKMDQVRIYTLRLEQQEIQDIYDVHAPTPPPPPTPPTYSNIGNPVDGVDGSRSIFEINTNDEWVYTGYASYPPSSATFRNSVYDGSWDTTNIYVYSAPWYGKSSGMTLDGDDAYHSLYQMSNSAAFVGSPLHRLRVSTDESGSWAHEVAYVMNRASSSTSLEPGRLVVDSNGIHIFFWENDGTNYNLRYLTNATGSWVAETLEVTTSSVATNSHTYWCAALKFSDGDVGCWYDIGGDLAYFKGTAGSFTKTTVDDSSVWTARIGAIVDSSNVIHAVAHTGNDLYYFEATAATLIASDCSVSSYDGIVQLSDDSVVMIYTKDGYGVKTVTKPSGGVPGIPESIVAASTIFGYDYDVTSDDEIAITGGDSDGWSSVFGLIST